MLISDKYRDMQRELHENPDYGVASVRYAPLVANVIRSRGIREMLDYGAGKGRLADELEWLVPWELQVHRYDPAIPEWSAAPQPCGFVTCIDVLEHIEPALLDNVLDDLRRVTGALGFFTVHTGTAVKVLADGRNAHLIQEEARWWLPKFLDRFELLQFSSMPQGFNVLVGSRQAGASAASSRVTAAMTGSQRP
jgi:hypothetical protein